MTYIKAEHITKIIRHQKVLNDLSFTMESGNIYGLCGINGSGKTMLMRALLGLIHPTSGTISIDGAVLGKDIEFPKSVGFLLENPAFLDRYSGFQNLMLLARIREIVSKETVSNWLEQVGLSDAGKKKYKKYSLGMKQRLGIAAALMEQPDIIILDEPTNALDASGVALGMDLVKKEKERGALVILSCHDADFLKKTADEILEMAAGEFTKISPNSKEEPK